MKKIFLFLSYFHISIFAFAQGKASVTNGIVYKKGTTETNQKSKKNILKELSEINTTYNLFDNLLYVGPFLWKRYSSIPEIKAIEGGNLKFNVPIKDTINNITKTYALSGKLIQKNIDFKIIWDQIIKDFKNTKISFRKLNNKELEYYWSVIFYDIEDPLFIMENSKCSYLIQMTPNGAKLLWIDETLK